MDYKQEIIALKKRLWEVEKLLSQFFDAQHATSMNRIDGTEDAICETTDDMTQGFADIEDAICELTELVNQ